MGKQEFDFRKFCEDLDKREVEKKERQRNTINPFPEDAPLMSCFLIVGIILTIVVVLTCIY